MFDNIGGKIKGLATFCAYACVIGGILVAIFGGVAYLQDAAYIEYATIYGGSSYRSLTEAGNSAYAGLMALKYGIIVGIVGFLSSWPLYGFGELIEKITYIADSMKKTDEKNEKV